MEHIRRNKKSLGLLATLGALGTVAVLLLAKGQLGSGEAQPWQIGLFALPWVLFVVSFLPLLYLSWFGGCRHPLVAIPLQALFWLIALAFTASFSFIYGSFVFGLF